MMFPFYASYFLEHNEYMKKVVGKWWLISGSSDQTIGYNVDYMKTKLHFAVRFQSQIPVVPSLRDEAMNLWEWQFRKKNTQSRPDLDLKKREKHWSQERNSHSAEAAENWVCSVCLCGACVWALIKDRRFFKHIRAILSNCFTPSSISTRTKDIDCSTKRCSPSLLCSITLSRPSADTNRQGPEELCSCVELVAAV